MKTSGTSWFEIDKTGLANLMQRKGPAWWAYELVQNAVDEIGVTAVTFKIEPSNSRGRVLVTVTDNSPNGWDHLSDAWTMFAPSKKAGDPLRRGRFNIGEKLFLSICDEAEIYSMKAGVRFNVDGTRSPNRKRTEVGTVVRARVKLKRDEVKDVVDGLGRIIPPEGVTIFVDDAISKRRLKVEEPVSKAGSTSATLPTEYANDEGQMRRTTRRTTVTAWNSMDGVGRLFEMGIPVCEIDAPYWVDVGQVVPMSIERDSVTEGYLRKLYGALLDITSAELEPEETAAGWVDSGLPTARPEAVKDVVETRFGDDAVVTDPSSPESVKEAINSGSTVIPSTAFSREAWGSIRSAREEFPDLAPSAGQAFPVGLQTGPEGVAPLGEDEITPAMEEFKDYALGVIRHLLLLSGRVRFYEGGPGWAAAWGPDRTLMVNVDCFPIDADEPTAVGADDLLLHEIAHEYEPDHLTHAYHEACTSLGARLRSYGPRFRE